MIGGLVGGMEISRGDDWEFLLLSGGWYIFRRFDVELGRHVFRESRSRKSAPVGTWGYWNLQSLMELLENSC